jgi:hypothetical protein
MPPSPKPRRYERIGMPQGLFVAWQVAGNRVVSRVATLGLGGLFIEAGHPAPAGELIRIFFRIPGGEVRARGTVRNSHPGKGMGVEFTSMGLEDRARLSHLLRKLLAAMPNR